MKGLTVGDLIKVPPVRTVIQMADLEDESLRRQLVETFVLTEEVKFTLKTILKMVSAGQGQGFFVIGNYGSGKSHLLTVLSILLSGGAEVEPLSDPELVRWAHEVRGILPVNISLVEHNSREILEQVLLQGAGQALGVARDEIQAWLQGSRSEAWDQVLRRLKDGAYRGLFFFVDELSEFLKAKPDGRRFNEDVRFLQYLGELSARLPLWILASLQERLEDTGEIHPGVFNKIKDRYPVRFQLSGEHIKEIIARRLVEHKEGAVSKIAAVYEALTEAFGSLSFSREEFISLYPVHPGTVELLDELKPFFSQHRGIIDFVHYRLKGDPTRRIPGWLEKPAAALLGPHFIFDHFRNRIREMVETNPYSEKVMRYFEKEVPRLFEDRERQEIALGLVKIMVLGAISPHERRFSVRELADFMLHPVTDLDQEVNYEYAAEILEDLKRTGTYITVEEAGATLARKYYIDLKADIGVAVTRRLEYIESTFFEEDRRLITRFLPLMTGARLPLASLSTREEGSVEVTWQNTRREGRLVLKFLSDVPEDEVTACAEELSTTEKDFALYLALPEGNLKGEHERLQSYLLECPCGEGFAFWLPREMTGEEAALLRRALAVLLLLNDVEGDGSDRGQQVRDYLKSLFQEKEEPVRSLFERLFFEGTIQGQDWSIEPETISHLGFEEAVQRLAGEILNRRFPRHLEFQPRGDLVTSGLVRRAIEAVAGEGVVSDLEHGTKMAVENYLLPLGLARRKGQGYELVVEPQGNALVKTFLDTMGEKKEAERLYWDLRKGVFGLSRPVFQTLALVLLKSGVISAFKGNRKINPGDISPYSLNRVHEFGQGSLIRPEFQEILKEVPFIPPRLKRVPVTFASQQALWDYLVGLRRQWAEDLPALQRQINEVRDYQGLRALDWQEIDRDLEDWAGFLEEVKISYSSQEGLERALAAYRSRPYLPRSYQRVTSLQGFLTERLRPYLAIYGYLQEVRPLPGTYHHLKEGFDLLWGLISREDFVFDDSVWKKLEEEFRMWQKLYGTEYRREHEKWKGQARFKPFRELLNSETYRLLELWGGLEGVVVDHDFIAVRRQIYEVLEAQCRHLDEGRLKERPFCSCGFRLGERTPLPAPSNLVVLMEKGLQDYLAALKEPDARERIETYLAGLETVGRRKPAAAVRELLQLDPQGATIPRLSKVLNRKVVSLLNEALKGRQVVETRYLEDLQELLVGRVYHPDRLLGVVRRWLEGDGKRDDVFIRVEKKRPGWISLTEVTRNDFPRLQDRLPEEILPQVAVIVWRLLLTKKPDQVQPALERLGWPVDQKTAQELSSLVDATLGSGLVAQEEVTSLVRKVDAEYGSRLLEVLVGEGFPAEKLWQEVMEEPLFRSVVLEGTRRLVLAVWEGIRFNRPAVRESTTTVPQVLEEELTPLKEEAADLVDLLERAKAAGDDLVGLVKGGVPGATTLSGWVRAYTERVSPVDMLLVELVKTLKRGGWLDLVVMKAWEERVRAAQAEFRERFRSFHRQLPGRPVRLEELLSRVAAGPAREAAGLLFIILDGVRVDVWRVVTADLTTGGGNGAWRYLGEGFHWARVPTNTEVQMEALRPRVGEIVDGNEELLPVFKEGPEVLESFDLKRFKEQALVIKFDFADARTHTSREDILTLSGELKRRFDELVAPVLGAVPSDWAVLLASDHGFVENPDYQEENKYKVSRYQHGGTSPEEVITPWLLIQKG